MKQDKNETSRWTSVSVTSIGRADRIRAFGGRPFGRLFHASGRPKLEKKHENTVEI